jgi:hypothetical protein
VRIFRYSLTILAAALLIQGSVKAATTIILDENCVGTIGTNFVIPCSLSIDPTTGMSSVVTYTPGGAPSFFPGDIVLLDPTTLFVSDVIRVSGNSLYFYSTLGGGSLADIGLPADFLSNVVTLIETDLGALGFGATYTPTVGQPGFVSVPRVPVEAVYTFISDEPASPVPEPGCVLVLGMGLLGLGLAKRRRSREGLSVAGQTAISKPV